MSDSFDLDRYIATLKTPAEMRDAVRKLWERAHDDAAELEVVTKDRDRLAKKLTRIERAADGAAEIRDQLAQVEAALEDARSQAQEEHAAHAVTRLHLAEARAQVDSARRQQKELAMAGFEASDLAERAQRFAKIVRGAVAGRDAA